MMSRFKFIFQAVLLFALAFLTLVACDAADDSPAAQPADNTSTGAAGGVGVADDSLNNWLTQLNNGEIPSISQAGAFDYGLGYLVYYGSIDDIGVDNIIYNALEARNRLETGERTNETLTRNEQNLLDMTEGLVFDPEVALTDQVQQSPEVRQRILDRVTNSQSNLSPSDALASGNVIGVFAPPDPQAIGSKYLVYTQSAPGADFNFLGVVIAADAVSPGAPREVYSFQGWESLPWLGDAGGPFWEQLPPGVSGDPSATDEGRPGVLLISEQTYRELTGTNAD
jgi:hypothetical protein